MQSVVISCVLTMNKNFITFFLPYSSSVMMSRRNGTDVKFKCRRNGIRRNGSRQNGTNHRRNGSRRNGSRRNGSDSLYIHVAVT